MEILKLSQGIFNIVEYVIAYMYWSYIPSLQKVKRQSRG